jgi:hypothetical protein
MARAQTGTSSPFPKSPELNMFSALDASSWPHPPDFRLLVKPAERVMGLNISPDRLPQSQEEVLPKLQLLERYSCPQSCRLCGVVDDQGTPIRFCTKG